MENNYDWIREYKLTQRTQRKRWFRGREESIKEEYRAIEKAETEQEMDRVREARLKISS